MTAAPARWTLESLERACRKALVQQAKVKTTAIVTHVADVEPGPNGSQKVRLDNLTVALLDGTVHEMLHVVLEADLLKFDGECEDAIIEGLERDLVDRINRSKARTLWWRRALHKKLGGR